MEATLKQVKYKDEASMSIKLCLISTVAVILKMITGSNLFLLIFLALQLVGIVSDKAENKINYLLFFMPWVYATKFNFEQLSLLTILSAVYCVVLALQWCLNRVTLSIYYVVSMVVLLLYLLFSVYISSNASLFGLLSFLLNYMVIYLAILFVHSKRLITTYVLMHALGLTLAGLTNLLGNVIPAIENYITSYTWYHTIHTSHTLYTRFTGLDLDPNYFSIQVLLAISCLCILLFSNTTPLTSFQKTASIVMALTLSIMGILTLSKMFLITFTVLLFGVMILLLKQNFKKGLYTIMITASLISLLLYRYYDYFYQAFFHRFFSEGSGSASITTGRSVIWLDYLQEITGDNTLFFMGSGLSDQFLNGRISHNMYLIAWYYVGLIGILLFLIWFITFYFQLKKTLNHTQSFSIGRITIIPLFIILLANFSLDSFIMDYFGIHIFLILLMLVIEEDKTGKSHAVRR